MKVINKIINFIKTFINKRKVRKALRKQNKRQKSQPMGMTYIDLTKDTNVLDVDLIDKNTSEELKKKVRQFTKVIIITYTIASIVWITWSYVLATYAMIVLANVEPMSSLSEKVCDVISGYIIVYCLKAFFETFAEKGMELIEKHITKKNNNILDKPINIDDISIDLNNIENDDDPVG